MTAAPDASPAAPEDALAALRGEIDALDDALHDLVMRRADVVARMAASRVKGDASSFRPGREATILRRLLARHSGPLPPAALARLWREILSASNAMQGGFSVALPEGDAEVYKAARARFGAMAAPDLRAGPEAALAALAEGVAQAAVLPVPAAEGASAWWAGLDAPRLQVVARLPFYAVAPVPRAMVVTRDGPDPSGDDRTLLRFAFGHGGDGAAGAAGADEALRAVAGALRDAGLRPSAPTLLSRQHDALWALAEVEGAVAADDARLSALRARLPSNRVRPLGFYATPIEAAAPDAGGGE
ncbi:chorismate mutase [Craurococcus roseus]